MTAACHRDRRSRRSRQVDSRPHAHRHRPRSLRRGEASRPDDRPRVRVDRAAVRRTRRRSSTSRVTCASSRTCSPASARSTPASSSSPRPKDGSRRARSTCASSSCSGSRHGVIALTQVDLVDDGPHRAREARRRRPCRGHVPRIAEVIESPRPLGVGVDELPGALDRLVATSLPARRIAAGRDSGSIVSSRRGVPAPSSPGTLTGGALDVDDDVVVEPGVTPPASPRAADVQPVVGLASARQPCRVNLVGSRPRRDLTRGDGGGACPARGAQRACSTRS